MDPESELKSKLISLFIQPIFVSYTYGVKLNKKQLSDIIQIISFIRSMDLRLQPKPETMFMSLVAQAISVFMSMDLDSLPKSLSNLISLCAKLVNPTNSDSAASDVYELVPLIEETLRLEPESKLISLLYQILFFVTNMEMKSKDENLVFVCPQAKVRLGADNVLYIYRAYQFPSEYYKWGCLNMKGEMFKLEGGSSYFLCEPCGGQNHENAMVEIKHPLHPKHPLHLVSLESYPIERKCYCCDEDLSSLIFCCLACNFAMNMVCVEKPPILSIDHPKWHEHPLVLFSRTTSLICDVCALVDSTCPIYICPPCGFVVHQTCLSLPHVIRISRHTHRISFTPSFDQGNWSCGVCRKEIHNDYGGYSCTKNGCSYAAHSKCATQSNVWDGEELEGVPEDDFEDVEPFVRINDRIIQHFSHQDHHLRFDENIDRDYDEDKICQVCITPIYFGNIYACMQCDYILHEECANLPRKMYDLIHPHLLTLVRHDGNVKYVDKCSACRLYCAVGLFYECPRKGCRFKVHVPCGVISEPLNHASHMHPLFLTSKPGEKRECSVCKVLGRYITDETFNCIECDFSLCFACATLPQKVRYKHDKHIFILSYGKEANALMSWCEVCEGKINTKKGFYMCDENCCVTLHIECMIGEKLYMKIGSSWFFNTFKVDVVPNKNHMTRPICSYNYCKKRCPKAFFQMSESGRKNMEGSIFCSTSCMECKYDYFDDPDSDSSY